MMLRSPKSNFLYAIHLLGFARRVLCERGGNDNSSIIAIHRPSTQPTNILYLRVSVVRFSSACQLSIWTLE